MRARNLRRRRNRTRATREPSTLTLRRVATSKRRKEKREKIFGKILFFFLTNFTRAALLGHEAASIFLIVNGGALPNSEPNAVFSEKSRRARQTKGRKINAKYYRR